MNKKEPYTLQEHIDIVSNIGNTYPNLMNRGLVMPDIFTTNDLSVPDDSDLDTGDTRRQYNTKCGKGYKSVNGKCVKKKQSK